jgi:hypothetical protein
MALVGILGLCSFQYVSTMLPQDLKFHRYKQAFREVRHPENTRFVGKYSFLGALDTQRIMYKETFPQGCDYIVGEVRAYTGPQDSIKTFYAMQALIAEQEEQRISVRFIPMDQDGHVDRYGWTEYGPDGDRLLESITSSPFFTLDPAKSFYFVSIWNFETPTSDIRCLL